MKNEPDKMARRGVHLGRRAFLKLPLAVGAAGALAGLASVGQAGPTLDEHDDRNIKLAHRVPPGLSDDELLFLKQIGLRWARLELQPGDAGLDSLARVQQRFGRYGINIFSAAN